MKRALLFGCNYSRPEDGAYALNGCINDVHSMANWLMTRGYTIEKILDDGSTPKSPSRATIIKSLQGVVAESKPGDQVFIHYSGHGGQNFESPEDEADGVDETIYGSGESYLEEITDDALRQTLVDAMPRGVRVRCVFDSCHSASVLDLPLRCVDGEKFIEEAAPPKGTEDILEISGCLDEQTSADAFIGGKAQGALTHAFLAVVRTMPSLTWLQVVGEIRRKLAGKYEQIPQLSVGTQALASRPMDV